jgi:hypothetical protein
MGRFVRNAEILEAMAEASRHGRTVSSLDSVARILDVEATPAFVRQARNLAYKTGDIGARRFLDGKRRRGY